MSKLDYACVNKFLKEYSKEKKWKTKDNLCAHEHKLNAKLKLRIDIDQIDANSNFASFLHFFHRLKTRFKFKSSV